MEKICVAIRVRPPTKPECHSAKGYKWRVGPHNVTLYSTLGTPVNGQSFAFDHVFGTKSKNTDIYHGLTKEVIMSTLSGFNGTVFAYGQTSSGKTYTMKGTAEDPGIIRLAVHDVFSKIQEITSREFLIRVSYMEIYNEEINDLFAPENRRLQIHENLEKGIFVAGLREEIVDSPEQVFHLLEFGESHRHFGETQMNLYSSRSHTIFRMVIESRDVTQDSFDVDANSDAVRVSALNLVDLAGSERIAKTGAGGVRLKEGTHINKSLMTLGTVINKLSDGTGKHGGHIPYRDSKLTRILQPALGGNARTAMICTVTPDEIHIDETRGTLQFASRAKRVTNCAQVNEILTDAALLKRQTKEIEDLRMKLQGLPQSEHLEKEILNLRNELLKYELEKERLFLELQEEKKAQVDRERRIKEQEQKIENLSTLFMSTNVDDRDSEKQPKKVNRRETWCPRQLNSDLAAHDFIWKSPGKQVEDEAIDSILYSMRRDRHFDLPPAFDTLVDDETWNESTGTEEPLPPSDFENIADEDTWMSLNKGHTTSSAVFTSNIFERSRSSGGSLEAGKIACLEADLKNLQEKYDDLRSHFDVKLQQSTKELRADVDRTKSQLEEVLQENGNLRSQLEKILRDNASLEHELSAQLESQGRLGRVIEDVECEMDAARLLTSSLQGILVDSLHVQALTLQSIQGCSAVAPPKGRVYKVKKLNESRALVESCVQKCRDICADVDGAVQDRLAHMNVRSVGNLECLEYDTKGKGKEEKLASSVLESRDAQRQEGFGTLSTGSDPPKSAKLGMYCGGCLSSVALSAVKPEGGEQVPSSEEDNQMICQCDLIAETHSRLMSLLRVSVCSTEHLSQIGSDGRMYGKRTSELLTNMSSVKHAEQDLRNGDVNSSLSVDSVKSSHRYVTRCQGLDSGEPESIEKDLVFGPHLGCSPVPLGRRCGECADHERVASGGKQIPVSMSKLCGHILKLLKPSFQVEEDAPSGVNNFPDFQDVHLKARLASAKVLTAWLFEELDSISKHDIHCLKLHVKERSSVGLMLEGLQVSLLENASLAVGLLQATCQEKSSINELVLRLQGLRDVYNNLPTLEPDLIEAGARTKKPDQVSNNCILPQLGAGTKVLEWFFDELFCQVGVNRSQRNVANGEVPAKNRRRLEFEKFQDVRPPGGMEPGLSRTLYREQGIRGVESVEGGSLVDLLDNGTCSVQETPGSSLDQGKGVPVEVSQQDLMFCSRMRDAGHDEQDSLIERLKMSREHIATLDRQLAVLYIEKDMIMKALVEELNGKEELVTTTKLQKARVAQSLDTFIGEVALHDEVLSAIRLGIQNFEQELEQRRPNPRGRTDTPIQIVQLAAPEQQAFPTISRMDSIAEASSSTFSGRVLKLQGVEEMLGKLLQYSLGRLLNREHEVVNGVTLLLVLAAGLHTTSLYPDESLELQLCVEKIEEVGSVGESDQSTLSIGASNLLHQSTRDLRLGASAAVKKTSMHVSTEVEDGAAAEGMRVILEGSGICSQKQLDVTICGNFSMAKTIKEFIWRSCDSNQKLREQLLTESERVKELEYRLASSVMEAVELKIELEDMRARLQICGVNSQNDPEFQFESELEALKIRCENYEEEIRLIMEQVPTPDDDLRREGQLVEVREENLLLRNRLAKATKRLARKERTKSSRTTQTQETGQTVKDKDLTVRESRVICDTLPRNHHGDSRLSAVDYPGTCSTSVELLAQDKKYYSLLNEVEVLKQKVVEQESLLNTQALQKPSSVLDNHQAKFDGDSTHIIPESENLTPRHLHTRSVRSALGELERNGKNENTVACRNPKRRRQLTADDIFSNKENLATYR